MLIEERPSPNSGPRRGGLEAPDLIVLHYTAMRGGAEPALRWLCDPASEVSCHYVVGETGRVWRLVPDDLRAWHAGAGEWQGRADVNSRSIGVELSNDGASPFPAPQMLALEALLRDLMARHAIGPAGVIGHSDCAPGRKIDPGPRFDWLRLARQGLAARPRPATADPERFTALARGAGYTAPVPEDVLLAAFRLRHRPHARGPADAVDAGLAAGLAALDGGGAQA